MALNVGQTNIMREKEKILLCTFILDTKHWTVPDFANQVKNHFPMTLTKKIRESLNV